MKAYVKRGVCLDPIILVVHGDALLEDMVLETMAIWHDPIYKCWVQFKCLPYCIQLL